MRIAVEPITERLDVFDCRWIQSPIGSSHTMWLLVVLRTACFFCMTLFLTNIKGRTLAGESPGTSIERST